MASLWKPPPVSLRLTQSRSLSGEWAVGWGPRCPGGGTVSDCGPDGCPAAQLKPGGWGAVVAEEVQMTLLTWRETRGAQETHALQVGPTDVSLPPHLKACHLRLIPVAMECRLKLTQYGGSVTSPPIHWLAQLGQAPPLGSVAAVGLTLSYLCPEMPARTYGKDATGPLYLPSTQHRPGALSKHL